MEISCSPSPPNKKEYITDIGKILVIDYGKKKYYKPKEVKEAHKKSKWHHNIDFSCWGMSTFSSHQDFDEYHKMTNEICDYTAMKSEMLNGLAVSSDSNWFDIPNLNIDASWLDFGNVFGGFLEGIGDFVAEIFE